MINSIKLEFIDWNRKEINCRFRLMILGINRLMKLLGSKISMMLKSIGSESRMIRILLILENIMIGILIILETRMLIEISLMIGMLGVSRIIMVEILIVI